MRKMKMKAALLCALLCAGAAFAQTPEDVAQKYNAAAELYNAKNYAQAVTALEEVVKMGLEVPDASQTVQDAQKLIPDAYFRKGLGEASGKKFEEALASFAKAEELAGLYGVTAVKNNAANMAGRVYMILGGTAFNGKDYPKAIEIFSQGYAKDPNNTDMALLLAKSYAESGDLTKAIEVYQNIIGLESTHSKYANPAAQAKEELTTYLLIEASTAAQANDLDAVKVATDAILAYDATNAAANMVRLQAATNAKNWDAVIEFGEAAAEAQTTPEEVSNAYFLLGAAYQNKDNKAKAVEMYRKVTAGPNVASAKQQIGVLQ